MLFSDELAAAVQVFRSLCLFIANDFAILLIFPADNKKIVIAQSANKSFCYQREKFVKARNCVLSIS